MGNLLPCNVTPGRFQSALAPTPACKSENIDPKTADTPGCRVRAVEVTSAWPCTWAHRQDTRLELNCCLYLRQTCQPAEAGRHRVELPWSN